LKHAGFDGKFFDMKTAIVDDKHRIRIPDLKPGQVFVYEIADDAVKLTPVKAEENIPIVNPIKQPDGSYHWPVDLSREEISAAIRADRDSR